jgi:hypothetical protein
MLARIVKQLINSFTVCGARNAFEIQTIDRDLRDAFKLSPP